MAYCDDAECDDPNCVSDDFERDDREPVDPGVLARIAEEAECGEDVILEVSRWTRYLLVENVRAAFSEDMGEYASTPRWGSALREIFAHFYSSPADAIPSSEDPDWVREYVQRVISAEGVETLRRQVAGDEYMTAFATREIIRATRDIVCQAAPKEDLRAAKRKVEGLLDLMEDLGESPELDAALLSAENEVCDLQTDERQACAKIVAANVPAIVHATIDTLMQSMNELFEVLTGMGFSMRWGDSGGTAMKLTTPPAELLDVVRGNRELKKIAEIAGRLREESKKRRETKWKSSRGEVSATTIGDDIARLLPSELMYAGDPDAEWLLLRKLTEKSAQQYDVIGRERANQGPIVLLIDESSSMSAKGRILWAKGVALALMEYASSQRRPFGVIGFSHRIAYERLFDPVKGVSASDMVKVLESFDNGGTDIGLAIDRGISLIEQSAVLSKADLVLISDGDDGRDRGQVLSRLAASDVELHSILLGGERAGDDLVFASAEVLSLTDSMMSASDSGASAIGSIFEIGQVIDVDG